MCVLSAMRGYGVLGTWVPQTKAVASCVAPLLMRREVRPAWVTIAPESVLLLRLVCGSGLLVTQGKVGG